VQLLPGFCKCNTRRLLETTDALWMRFLGGTSGVIGAVLAFVGGPKNNGGRVLLQLWLDVAATCSCGICVECLVQSWPFLMDSTMAGALRQLLLGFAAAIRAVVWQPLMLVHAAGTRSGVLSVVLVLFFGPVLCACSLCLWGFCLPLLVASFRPCGHLR
jgi:hypothetical protein